MIDKTLNGKLNIEQHEPHKNTRGELSCFWISSSFCSTSDILRVILYPELSFLEFSVAGTTTLARECQRVAGKRHEHHLIHVGHLYT